MNKSSETNKPFEIIRKEQLTSNIWLFEVRSEWIARAAKPGQFVIVIIDEKGERIPLTICDYDTGKESITLVVQIVGKSTERMIALNEGDCFRDIVGPLGKESELLHLNSNELAKSRVLFVAGGVGTAPVYPQVKWAKANGLYADVIIGTKSRDTLILEDKLKAVADNLYIYTDDGSYGTKGLVTDGIKHLIEDRKMKYDEIIAIGPMIMMKFVAALTKQYGIKTTVSLNTLMVDGTGMCGACRVSVGDETKFTCVDGPEFNGHLINWDEAITRQGMYRSHEIATDTKDHKCNLTADVEQSVAVKKQRVPAREQKPEIRIHNFEEVCFGYNEEEAVEEAMRCLNCKKPLCVKDCPVAIDIPTFINKVKERDFKASFEILSQSTALPAVCGRVCPQETQCEGSCILGKKGEPVAIGKLERFVADWARENGVIANADVDIKKKNASIAVVGAGPSGLTCAGELAKMGYDVTVFEALHEAGGVLVYGIPEFRLPKESVVKTEVDNVKRLGVKIVTDVIIGRSITIDELLEEGFAAVYIASGAGLPKFMDIKGINLNGVLSANELLTRSNLMKAYKDGYDTPIYPGSKTVIVGGGNVAMDAARTAKRLGADTHVVYRRSQIEMPARVEEVHHAIEEGIHFHFMTNPTEIIGNDNGWVKAIRCIKMALGEPDDSGRRRPIEIAGSEYEIETDCVVMSLGTMPNKLIADTTKGLSIQTWGGIIADSNGATSRKGIFAGGDAVIGAATVILAMGAGKTAAHSIDEYLRSNSTK
ncbi:MAG: bifunctional dihydroorotate dehydrogenase B NAD binding subunit/NADPH-dependent glutamate synthase [Bacteroidales bacterium]|jgi:glutamate synthase (NADPH/NADH) small chain|nr:bifunctional dihydroorotate dehydrogenase B NAD binding subunit/NADPH-dependent glutamate synthase [Bacteroidales bacterium]